MSRKAKKAEELTGTDWRDMHSTPGLGPGPQKSASKDILGQWGKSDYEL